MVTIRVAIREKKLAGILSLDDTRDSNGGCARVQDMQSIENVGLHVSE